MKLSKYRKEIVLIMDLCILLFVSTLLYFIFNDQIKMDNQNPLYLVIHFFLMTICGAASQYLYRTYNSLWRYAQSKEYMMLLLGGISGYIFYLLIEVLIPGLYINGLYTLAVYILYIIGMLLMRLCYREYRNRSQIRHQGNRIPVAIVGAGEAGVKLVEELKSNPKSPYYPVCFIDDSIEKIGQRIHGIEVKGPISHLQYLLTKVGVREVVIAIPSVSIARQKEILQACAKVKCRVQILPDNLAFLKQKGEETLWSRVRNIQLDELLGREMVSLETEDIRQFLYHKVILVTGGGGSIGSELCRQIALANPELLIILDIYENNAYEIQQELSRRYHHCLNVKVEIASVRDVDKINYIFDKYRPQLVFHAAAHKHVPLMENNPDEAIRNNILGTYNVVMASDLYKAERFVLISTDKAVNPTSVMGATKRFCEMLIQSMKDSSETEYVAVRFGNVLGSNGSVVPLFQKQIAEGGPVTITDKRIVRFFMTIAEAVQLVLKAGGMAERSEIYVLDMGKPVQILELAENLIRLSGYVPYDDIPIIETGLRPGEKLYEEMLMNSNSLKATANHKIYIEQQNQIAKEEMEEGLALLIKALNTNSNEVILEALRQVVPTFREPSEVNEENNRIEDKNIID